MTEMQAPRKNARLIKWLIAAFAGVLIFGGGYWYFVGRNDAVIDYLPERDRSALEAIFEQNYYWLINLPYKEALDDFGHDLDGAENRNGTDKTVTYRWLVYREKGIVKGFATYFFKPGDIGRILFLAVDEKFRGAGCAKRLMQRAIEKLEQGGAKVIEITVRTENYRAQNLYRKLGFVTVRAEEEFIYMERRRG